MDVVITVVTVKLLGLDSLYVLYERYIFTGYQMITEELNVLLTLVHTELRQRQRKLCRCHCRHNWA